MASRIEFARKLLGARTTRRIRLWRLGEEGMRESRFDPPRDHCPHPEWWHTMDPIATEIEVSEAIAGLVRALQPEYVIETGTASGQTAVAIGKALKRNGHGKLVSLEIVAADVEHGRQLCHGLPVEVRHQSSLEFTPDQPIDFAWFDTEFAIRAEEFRRYHPWMHSGTVVGFHDTAPFEPTRGYIDELETDGLLKAIDLVTPRGFTLGQALGTD